MTRATVFWQQGTPLASSSACTRGLPYVPRLSAWAARTCPANSARRAARADGGRRSRS